MSVLSYQGLVLSDVQTISWEREAKLSADRTTYEYTINRLTIQCVYSPGTTNYFFSPGGAIFPGTNNPSQSTYQTGPATDVAIRHVLMQPRGPLLFYEESDGKSGNNPLVMVAVTDPNAPAVDPNQ